MARLPIPGSDNGTWGNLLNDYLQVAHDSGGALKSDAVSTSSIQDNSIDTAKLDVTGGADGQVLTKNSALSGGMEWTSAAGSPDATTSSKGLVQLAGDLAGTASLPTVPGLASKANTSTTVSAGTGLSGGGDLSTNRTISANFGTTAGTIAQGNDSRITGAEQTANKGAASGYASLDGSTKVPIAQIPTGTTSSTVAIGNDSRITGAVQSTLVDAKGDILAATAADTIARLAVGTDGQVLTADSTQTTGIKWATPSGGSGTELSSVYPLSAYGFFTASTDLDKFNGGAALTDAWFARVFVPAGKAINAIATIVKTAGVVDTGGLNGFAIYDDAGTLVSSTTDDNTMWQATGWIIKALGSPIAAQGSDRFVYTAMVSRGYTATKPSVLFYAGSTEGTLTTGGGYLVNNRRSFFNGIDSWPASLDPTSYGNSTTGFLPLITLG